MKFRNHHRVLFFAIVFALASFQTQAQTNDNTITLVEKFQFKQYDNGTIAGYFTLDGSFTMKDLHRVEQYFMDMDAVLDFSIIEKNEARSKHTAFIRTNDLETSKTWINTKLNQGLAAHKFEMSWAE